MTVESVDPPDGLDWDLWLGPAPQREYHKGLHPFGWRGYWDFGTGALGDMACHLIEPAFKTLELGYPVSVECSVGTVYTGPISISKTTCLRAAASVNRVTSTF